MAGEIERFNHTVPSDFTAKEFDYWLRRDVPCRTIMYRFHGLSELVGALGHASIISTMSRTAQSVFVTPAAIAGVQRTALLIFTKL
ncbi:hypothetical protein BH18VER1_BH18VER1_07880 [soil metagenome]